jgi:hypothetical protein
MGLACAMIVVVVDIYDGVSVTAVIPPLDDLPFLVAFFS